MQTTALNKCLRRLVMTSVDRTAMQRPRPNWLPEEEFPFGSKFLEVNGHSIHYIDEGSGWTLLQGNPRVARMLRLVGSRPIKAINWATNLLAWGMSSSYGVGRHLTRRGKVAFRGPYRDRRVRGRALTMLRDGARADA